MIHVTNTLTGKKELFKPLHPPKVTLYVCGITPYDAPHIGHGRVYVTFDVLYRLLQFSGYQVTYCRNFTDIDDKLLNKAEKEFGNRQRYPELATRYIQQYHADMRALGCVSPTHEPRVTDNIPTIITFIQNLIDARKAYVVDGDVYFDIQAFPAYGQLAKHKREDLHAGARVDINEKKKDPLDFALWKSEAEGTFWQSPWGYGRPGWHIECSALAAHFLGKHIDIHAGGADLMFPHHENEIAQSEALYGPPFARYWMHNGLVTINNEKMSKSLGNFFLLHDIFSNIDPIELRFYFLSHHYRTPLEFSVEGVASYAKAYARVCKTVQHVVVGDMTMQDARKSAIVSAMVDFIADDLNTPGMFGVLFEHLTELQTDESQARAVKYFLQQVLGLPLVLHEKKVSVTPAIEQLLAEREKARAAKNWARADQIRDELKALGYQVQDAKKTH